MTIDCSKQTYWFCQLRYFSCLFVLSNRTRFTEHRQRFSHCHIHDRDSREEVNSEINKQRGRERERERQTDEIGPRQTETIHNYFQIAVDVIRLSDLIWTHTLVQGWLGCVKSFSCWQNSKIGNLKYSTGSINYHSQALVTYFSGIWAALGRSFCIPQLKLRA